MSLTNQQLATFYFTLDVCNVETAESVKLVLSQTRRIFLHTQHTVTTNRQTHTTYRVVQEKLEHVYFALIICCVVLSDVNTEL